MNQEEVAAKRPEKELFCEGCSVALSSVDTRDVLFYGGRRFCNHACAKREEAERAAPTIRPNYYKATLADGAEVECFQLIDALELDFYLGNALKYLWRAGKKDGASKKQDLKKIRTYIDQALERCQ